MAVKIKQGDAFDLGVTLSAPTGGTGEVAAVTPATAEAVEVYLGGKRKTYPGDVSYDADSGMWLIHLTQEDTFDFPANASVEMDIRIRFFGGIVLGIRKKISVFVVDAVSQEVI